MVTYSKLGSLFDGAGVFPLAANMCGLNPVWASEIEPFPIAVTKKRFPNMNHLGDVTKINGAGIEPVDVITFGSPCQDVSVAGKMDGLRDGTRSSLFFEAIRIIKEMRENTDAEQPRFVVWENVPGALQSNDGDDFRTVLEELAKIGDRNCSVPESPIKSGNRQKWPTAGQILGDGFSVAWRVLDAQFWGVPQARRRVFVVADFGRMDNDCAGRVLFVREGLSRNFASIRRAWEEDTGPFDDGPVGASEALIEVNEETGTVTINESVYRTINLYTGEGNSVPKIPDAGRVRRMSPVECAMLMGMPSWWTADVDGPFTEKVEYKMWGNSVALPCVLYVIEGVARELYKSNDAFVSYDVLVPAVREVHYYEYKEQERSATLKASGGTFGGGSETLVIENNYPIFKKI
ncbi:DNA cytosine methyltransferase [Methanolapillus millepedarum]|uniref:Modification methylase HhaI n=1 Tax=Methanolapillus millepedarum TaxID=3028296 RepID=A0AA96ZUZ4_9EURY|nr:Modification methylase HhaI [Methanosarcinaceae archaeon Ac7]